MLIDCIKMYIMRCSIHGLVKKIYKIWLFELTTNWQIFANVASFHSGQRYDFFRLIEMWDNYEFRVLVSWTGRASLSIQQNGHLLRKNNDCSRSWIFWLDMDLRFCIRLHNVCRWVLDFWYFRVIYLTIILGT